MARTGRPCIRKKGPLTHAERQKRYRARIRKAENEIKDAARKARSRERRIDPYNIAKFAEREAEVDRKIEAYRAEWTRRYGQAPMPPLPGASAMADELVRQIAECIMQSAGEMSIADVRAAINRRFG
jgi:hypothetical protein